MHAARCPANLRIAVTGATGAVGRRLIPLLAERGHNAFAVRRLGKEPANAPNVPCAVWNVQTGQLDLPASTDVLIHLAGRNVMRRWSARVKAEIWDSRVTATRKMCEYLAAQPAERRPRQIVSASAIGIYGDRGDAILTEDSPLAAAGESFLGDVCRAWEAATCPVETEVLPDGKGIRVTHLRIGVALSAEAGALASLARLARWGLGGTWGGGRQFIPWISMADLARLIIHLCEMDHPPGVLNAVSPEPVRQRELVKTICRVLRRPMLMAYPQSVMKLIFGQMGCEALLASHRVMSKHMPKDFAFEHPTVESALRQELVVKRICPH